MYHANYNLLLFFSGKRTDQTSFLENRSNFPDLLFICVLMASSGIGDCFCVVCLYSANCETLCSSGFALDMILEPQAAL